MTDRQNCYINTARRHWSAEMQ